LASVFASWRSWNQALSASATSTPATTTTNSNRKRPSSESCVRRKRHRRETGLFIGGMSSRTSFLLLPLESLRDDIDLARFLARRLRLSDQYLLERLAQFLHVFVRPRALEHLRGEAGAGLQHLFHRVQRQLEQVHRACLVGGVDAGQIRRDVRDDEVELPAIEPAQQLLDDRVLGEVALDEVDVGHPV